MDFRSFLELLDKNNELIRIKKKVSIEYEVAGIIDALGEKPVFFEHIKESDVPIVAGLLSSKELIARALNTQKVQILKKLSNAIENPLSPSVVEKGECQEIIKKNEIKETPVPKIKIPVRTDQMASPTLEHL